MEANHMKYEFIDDEVFLPSHCVNPHEINPFALKTGVSKSKINSVMEERALKQDCIKLEMEEFRDLHPYLPASRPLQSTNELNTPIFYEENPFDFAFQKSTFVTGKSFELDCNLIEVKDSVLASQLNKDFTVQQHQQQQLQQQNVNSEIIINYLQQQQNSVSPSETPIVLNDDQISCASYFEDSVLCDKYSNISSPSTVHEEYSNTNDMEKFSMIVQDDQHSNTTMSNDYPIIVKRERPDLHLSIGVNTMEPSINTPEVINSVISLDDTFNILDYLDNKELTTVKVEDILPSTPSPLLCVESKKRRRQSSLADDEDFVYEEQYNESDSDEEYLPKKKRRGRPPKRRVSVNSESSDASKYRELRDKNNEASRKSRLKRKIKEKTLEDEADVLYEKNIKLKAQVGELERMVNNFRSNLFKIMLKK